MMRLIVGLIAFVTGLVVAAVIGVTNPDIDWRWLFVTILDAIVVTIGLILLAGVGIVGKSYAR